MLTRTPRNRRARRWSDNDVYFGPLTFSARSKHSGRSSALLLCSGDGEERAGASFRITLAGYTAILALPQWVLQPHREKRFPNWDAATVARLGRDWYYDYTERQYGVSLFENHFSVRFGRQSHDSSTEQSWSCFLPWTQWRHVRHSLYGVDGSHFADMPHRWSLGDGTWEARERIEESCPTTSFSFRDFDGEQLTATTKIEEREWLLGEGGFTWLALFCRPKIRRSLDIRFSGETGRRKGSWKGGTIGHSIDMLPGELHEAAFRRYCAEHSMEFIG